MNTADAPVPRRILVIDDNEAIHEDFRKILAPPARSPALSAAKAALFGTAANNPPAEARPEFELDTALQGQAGVEKARAALERGEPYQVAFVDMRMPPGWDGLTTIKHLWRADAAVQTVICTAHSDYSLEQITDELGVSDRLLMLKKPFDPVEILQLATALSEKWRAQRAAALKLDELERMVQARTAEIEHAMLHDRLTGLPNRTLIVTHLETCIQRRRRNPNYKFAVLFLDFDRFKLINDSLGHETGDLLLIEISDRLRNSLRATDQICHQSTPSRLGGDEFVVLLDDLREEHDAARVAERLLDVLIEPHEIEGQKLHATASIGIATSDRNYERAGDMLRDADTAMYRAKAGGRNRYVMFDRHMHEQVMARLSLETELRKAVREDGLGLHYQPIVRLSDGSLSGFEALVRWSHPTQGPVPAAELIAVAEDTGLIQPLSISLLRIACRQLRAWHARVGGAEQLLMSVNLSRKQLIDPDLVGKIARTLRDADLPPGSLILEITESTVIDDKDAALAVFEQLKELGVWLHLDDFGTGYSSLSCLYQLPLSGLKIDRAFIQDICRRGAHAVVLRSIVQIARAFNLQVIAEGVETTEQFALLRELDIDYAQGYLFGKPAAAEDVEHLVAEPKLVVAGH